MDEAPDMGDQCDTMAKPEAPPEYEAPSRKPIRHIAKGSLKYGGQEDVGGEDDSDLGRSESEGVVGKEGDSRSGPSKGLPA